MLLLGYLLIKTCESCFGKKTFHVAFVVRT